LVYTVGIGVFGFGGFSVVDSATLPNSVNQRGWLIVSNGNMEIALVDSDNQACQIMFSCNITLQAV